MFKLCMVVKDMDKIIHVIFFHGIGVYFKGDKWRLSGLGKNIDGPMSYNFIPASVTLIGFQGHSDVKKWNQNEMCVFSINLYPIKFKACIIALNPWSPK